MVHQEWKPGFGVRIGRAIDRWAGGGQRAFERALKEYAKENAPGVPTSYRTIVNYVNEATTPSEAWMDAAAAVLRWNPANLKYGEEPERLGEDAVGRYALVPHPDTQGLGSALVRLFVNRYSDLPMPARLMIFGYLLDHFEGDDSVQLQWAEGMRTDHDSTRAEAVDGVLADRFGPLLSRPTITYTATMALAASLTAGAYVLLGTSRATNDQEGNTDD